MPGWHEATARLRDEGKLRMIGIVQEQHADRARLFMQWKGMDWPILVDALNRLGVGVVPITWGVDEHGIVRSVGPGPRSLEAFLASTSAPEDPRPVRADPTRRSAAKKRAKRENSAAAWEAYADALVLTGGDLRAAAAAYGRAVKIEPGRDTAHFRLGVVYRMLHDSSSRRTGDFQRAVDQWTRALERNPNNYIYRRRIQQYGPRLAKPYPFYDWIREARREIESRGETPVALFAEPGGAEIAAPARTFPDAAATAENPDPRGEIHRDPGRFVAIETTVVPDPAAGGGARVHVSFTPRPESKAHWNNEVDGLVVWLDAREGWTVDRRRLFVPNPPSPVSREARRVEFEVKAMRNRPGPLAAYALYYVCETARGTCLYRRQDFSVEVD